MANRIDKLKSKSTEIVDEKKHLQKESAELRIDKATVSEMLATISDEQDVDIVQEHNQTLESDISVNEDKDSANKEVTIETLAETDTYLSGLEQNLSKLEQIKGVSDLVKDSSTEVSTKRRISELESIKSLLGEEYDSTEWKGDSSSVSGSKSAFESLMSYMCLHDYGPDDFDEYSRDPEWQKLHKAAFPQHYEKLAQQNQINLSTFNSLCDSDMANVLTASFNKKVDANQSDTDTQRFFNAIGWASNKPMVLNEEKFENLRQESKAITLYHTDKPSHEVSNPALYAQQFMSQDADRSRQYMSSGIHGDGTYFSNNSEGAWAYGVWNPESTQFKAFLNSNAKPISETNLDRLVEQFSKSHPNTYNILLNCQQGLGSGKTAGMKSVIAAINGYNVILSDGFLLGNEQYFTVLDRSAVTVCDKVMYYKDVDKHKPENW